MPTVDAALLARIVRELWGLTGREADLANQRARLMLGKARALGWDLHIVDGPRDWGEHRLRRRSLPSQAYVELPVPEEDVFDPDLEPPPPLPPPPKPPVKGLPTWKPFPPKPVYGRYPRKPKPTNILPRPIQGCDCSLAGCEPPCRRSVQPFQLQDTPFWAMNTIPGIDATKRKSEM